jgi:hypothetical protein
MHLLHRHGRPSRSVKESQLLSFPFGSSPWISDKKPPSYPTLLDIKVLLLPFQEKANHRKSKQKSNLRHRHKWL